MPAASSRESVLAALRARLARQVRSEPKKAAALAVLLATMAGMWGKVLFLGNTSPSAASAAASAGGAGAYGGVHVRGAGAFGGGSDTRNGQSGGFGPPLSHAVAALQEWKQGPINAAHRNLFLVKLDYFAKEGSAEAGRAAENREGFWDQVAKSLAARADQEKARRILVENLQAQASRLNLQSTVMSNGTTKAMVNGVLVEEGDTVSGFKILRIESRRMVVEREGIKLEVLFN